MKSFFVTLFLALAATTLSYAQEATLQTPNVNQSGPILVDGKLVGFYSLKEKLEKRQGIFKITALDGEMKETGSFETQMPMNTEPIGAAFNGSHYLLVFFNLERQFLKYITLSATGALVKERSLEKIGLWSEGNEGLFAQVFAAGADGFYLVKPSKQGKTGFIVEKTGNDLSSLWTKSYVPEKGSAIFYTGMGSAGELVFLQLRQKPLQERKYNFELTALDGQTGKERFNEPLHSDELLLFPTGHLLLEENQVALAGMYFEGKKVKDKNSDGLFVSIYDLNGKKLKEQLHDWKSMEDAFSSYKKFMAKKPKVMMHSLVRDGENYLLVGEIFQRSAGNEGKTLNKIGFVDKDENAKGEVAGQLTLLDFAAFKIKGSDLGLQEVLFCHKKERIISQTDFALVDIDNNDFALALQAAGKTPNVNHSNGGGQSFSFIGLDKTADGEPVIYFTNEDNPLEFHLGVATLRGSDFSVKKYPYENLLALLTGGRVTVYLPLKEGKVLKNVLTGKKDTWELKVQ